MPNKLPPAKGVDVIRVLFKLGFEIKKKRRGSHLILRKNSIRVTVPMHKNKDIPKGTLLSILRQAKISKKEFLDLL